MKRLVILLLTGICLNATAQITSNGVYPVVAGGQTIGLLSVAVPQLPAIIFTNTFTNTVTVVVTNSGGYPLGPTNLQAFTVTSNSVVLGWQNRSTALNIQVIRDNCKIATLASNATTFFDTSVSPSTAYQYQLQAGFSDAAVSVITSNPAAPAGLVAPTGLSMTSPSIGTAILTCQCAVAPPGLGIFIDSGLPGGGLTGWKMTNTTGTAYSSERMTIPSGTHTFKVDAHDANWVTNMFSTTISGVVQ
jgi:hypothetical protein